MNLYRRLLNREKAGHPIRVGLIGAGKFGTMYLSQAARTPGIHLMGLADLDPDQAQKVCAQLGGYDTSAPGWTAAYKARTTHVTDDPFSLIQADGMDVVIDATGHAAAGIEHALSAIDQGRHIIMVNVEADALAGPWLARRARQSDLVYSMAYGDQPALIAEQVDWARASGFEVVAAGKGTKYLESYHYVTPDEVWQHYGLNPDEAMAGGLNPKMFNSFLDGTKSAIEMAAVSNATGLTPAPGGLAFPPCGVHGLPHMMRPRHDGGRLHHKGQVEVVSSLERDGRPIIGDLRWGVFVVFEAPNDYVRMCFREYGLLTDTTGRYSAMWKPYHLIGMELGISVASVALRCEPTGQADSFRSDVVATAKRNLRPGDHLDGEGGFTIYGRLMSATDSLAIGALPIGLAHDVTIRTAVAKDRVLTWEDIETEPMSQARRVRREMESMFAPQREGGKFI